MSNTSWNTRPSTTDSPVLPPELLLRIFAQLDPNARADRSTLAQCALISATFRHDAQKRLFSSVNLAYTTATDEPPSAHVRIMTADTVQSNKFQNAITLTPILATFVRHLHIHLPCKSMGASGIIPHKPESYSFQFVVSCTTHLEAFSWHSPHTFRLIHFRLSKKLQDAIQAVLLANNLREIDMRGINQLPPALLCSSSNLKTLAVTDLPEYVAMDSAQPPRSIVLTSLTTLTLSNGLASLVRFLQNPTCPITLSMLQSLDVKAHGFEHESVCAILQMCGHTLTQLHCHFHRAHPALSPPSSHPIGYSSVDLSNLSRLTGLHLSGKIEREWSSEDQSPPASTQHFSPIPWISGALESLPDASVIAISLVIDLEISYIPSATGDDTIPWDVLVDAIQLRGRKYKSLRVNLEVDDTSIDIVKSLSTVVPDLQTRRDILRENVHLTRLGDALVCT